MMNTPTMESLILKIIDYLSISLMHSMGIYHELSKANLEAFTINRHNLAIARGQHSCCSWLIV